MAAARQVLLGRRRRAATGNMHEDAPVVLLPPLSGESMQYYRPGAATPTLAENCSLLGLRVVRCPFGRAAETQKRFAAGSVVGFMFGIMVTDACFKTMQRGRWTEPVEGEDYATPLRSGQWRSVATADGTLIASEQCPMALINHSDDASKRNVCLDLSGYSAVHDPPDRSWMAFPVLATRDIPKGEQLMADYNWTVQQWRLARRQQTVAGARSQEQAAAAQPAAAPAPRPKLLPPMPRVPLKPCSRVFNLCIGLGRLSDRFKRQDRALDLFLEAHRSELASMPYEVLLTDKFETPQPSVRTELRPSTLLVPNLMGIFVTDSHAQVSTPKLLLPYPGVLLPESLVDRLAKEWHIMTAVDVPQLNYLDPHSKKLVRMVLVGRPSAVAPQINVNDGREKKPANCQLVSMTKKDLEKWTKSHRLGHRKKQPVPQHFVSIVRLTGPAGILPANAELFFNYDTPTSAPAEPASPKRAVSTYWSRHTKQRAYCVACFSTANSDCDPLLQCEGDDGFDSCEVARHLRCLPAISRLDWNLAINHTHFFCPRHLSVAESQVRFLRVVHPIVPPCERLPTAVENEGSSVAANNAAETVQCTSVRRRVDNAVLLTPSPPLQRSDASARPPLPASVQLTPSPFPRASIENPRVGERARMRLNAALDSSATHSALNGGAMEAFFQLTRNPTSLREQLHITDRSLLTVLGDGDCQWRSLSHLLRREPTQVQQELQLRAPSLSDALLRGDMAAVRSVLADQLSSLVEAGSDSVSKVVGNEFAALTAADIHVFRHGAWNNTAQECAMKLACGLLAVGIVCVRDGHPAFRITGRPAALFASPPPQINISGLLVHWPNHFDVAVPLAQVRSTPRNGACPFAPCMKTLTRLLDPLGLRLHPVPGLRSCVFEALVDAYIEADGPVHISSNNLQPFGVELYALLQSHNSGRRVGRLPPIQREEAVALLRMRAIDAILESRTAGPTRAMHPTNSMLTAWQWLQEHTQLHDAALISALNAELRAESCHPALAEEILPVLARALDFELRVVDGTQNNVQTLQMRKGRSLVITLVRAGASEGRRYASTRRRISLHAAARNRDALSGSSESAEDSSSSSGSDADLSAPADAPSTDSESGAERRPAARASCDKLHVSAAVLQREDVKKFFSKLNPHQHAAVLQRYNDAAKRKIIERDGKPRPVVPWFALNAGNELKQLPDYGDEAATLPRKGSRRWVSAAGLSIDYALFRACCGDWTNVLKHVSQTAAALSKEEHPSHSVEAMFTARLAVRNLVKDKRQFMNYVAQALASRMRSDMGPAHDRVATPHGSVCTSCYRALLGVSRSWLFSCVVPTASLAATSERYGSAKLALRNLVAGLLKSYCKDVVQFDPAGSRSRSQFRQVWHVPQFSYRQLCDELNADLEHRLESNAALRSQVAALHARRSKAPDLRPRRSKGNTLVTESTLRRVIRYMLQKEGVHISLAKGRSVCACKDCSSLDAQLSRVVPGTDAHAAILRQKIEHKEAFKLQRAHFNRRKLEALQDPLALWTVTFDGMDQSKTALPHRPQMSKGTDGLKHFGVHVVGVYAFGAPLPVMAYFNNETVAKDSNLSATLLFDILDKQWHKLLDDYNQAAQALKMDQAAADAVSDQSAESPEIIEEAAHVSAASRWPRRLHLTFDNTASEAKNQHFFRAAGALVHFGVFEAITISNMLVGHTHDIVDQMFSVWAMALNIRCVHTLSKLKRLFRQAYGTKIQAISALFYEYKFKSDPDAQPTAEELASVQGDMDSLEITQKEFLEFLGASGSERQHLAEVRNWDKDLVSTMLNMAHELSNVAPEMFDIEHSIDVKKWFEDNCASLDVRVNFKRLGEAYVFAIEKDQEDGCTYLFSRFLADFDDPMPHEGVVHHYPKRLTGDYSTRSILFAEHSQMPVPPTQAPLREFDREMLRQTIKTYNNFKLLRPEEVLELEQMLKDMEAAVDKRGLGCKECETLTKEYHDIGVIHQKSGASEAEKQHANEQKQKRNKTEKKLREHLADPKFTEEHRLFVDRQWWRQWLERAKLIQKSFNDRASRIYEKKQLLRTTYVPYHAHPKELCSGYGERGVMPAMKRVDCQWLEKRAPPKVNDIVVVRSAWKNDAFELGTVKKLLSNPNAPRPTAKHLEHLGQHAARIDLLSRNTHGNTLMRERANEVVRAVREVPSNELHRTALRFMHTYWLQMCAAPNAPAPGVGLFQTGVGSSEWRRWLATQRCYEVRASRAVAQRLNTPTQVGLFATRAIKKDVYIDWYGGIIVWGEDLQRETDAPTTHARSLGSHAPGFVQDGWPMAAAVTRYVATTKEALPTQLLLRATDFHPRKQYESDVTPEALNLIQQYDSMPLGFLANSAANTGHTPNVRVVSVSVGGRKCEQLQGKQSREASPELAQHAKALHALNVDGLHMLQASRDIALGEELLTYYNSHEERNGFLQDQPPEQLERPQPQQQQVPQSPPPLAVMSPPAVAPAEQRNQGSETAADKGSMQMQHLPHMLVERWEYDKTSVVKHGFTEEFWTTKWEENGEVADGAECVKPQWLVDLFADVRFVRTTESVVWEPSSLVLWGAESAILTKKKGLKKSAFDLVRADLTGTEAATLNGLVKPKKPNTASFECGGAAAPMTRFGTNRSKPAADLRARNSSRIAKRKARADCDSETEHEENDEESDVDSEEPSSSESERGYADDEENREEGDSGDEFVVEAIVRQRERAGGQTEYLVKWANYPLDEEDDVSWLPEDHLQGSSTLLEEFRKEQEALAPEQAKRRQGPAKSKRRRSEGQRARK